MGSNQKKETKSRRWFLSLLIPDKTKKVKMLTADGKLVEVDKAVYDQAVKNQKATNKEVYDWMKNPSKDKN